MLFRRSLLAGPLAAALFALAPSGVSSQGSTPLFGVGYTANAPRLLAGGRGGLVARPHGRVASMISLPQWSWCGSR